MNMFQQNLEDCVCVCVCEVLFLLHMISMESDR